MSHWVIRMHRSPRLRLRCGQALACRLTWAMELRSRSTAILIRCGVSQLAEDLLTASFIADGHHLPAETLKAMICAKGLERSILVSDAVALAGMAPGRYNASIGGRVELFADGRLAMEGASTLAGAAIPLITCIGRAVRMTGRTLAQVLTMATENPGRFAGDRGSLAVGARADILRFSWNEETCQATVKDVWLAGEQMYAAE
jgi:N-acetylglucosamine-6-phosphate deacetylase